MTSCGAKPAPGLKGGDMKQKKEAGERESPSIFIFLRMIFH